MATLFSREPITADDYSPVISVVTWVLLVSMMLVVCMKVGMQLLVSRRFAPDNGVVMLAMAFGIGQSIAVSIQAANGLGKREIPLTASQIEIYEKAGYSSSLLFITSLATSKIATLILHRQITPVVLHRRLALALGAFVALWTVGSLLASAFQCSMPKAWSILGPQCFDQMAFWTSYGAINITTEIALVVLPIYTVWDVHIVRKQKIVIIGCFASRLAVVGAIIGQLDQVNRLRDTSDTFDVWPYVLCTQLVQNLSIITACIPYIKNLLVGLESGMMQTGDFKRRKNSPGSSPYNGSLVHSSARRQGTLASANYPPNLARGKGSAELNIADNLHLGPLDTHYNSVMAAPASDVGWDGGSQSSRSKIIKKTTEVQVDYERQQHTI